MVKVIRLSLAISFILLLSACRTPVENAEGKMPGVRSVRWPAHWRQLKGEDVWLGHTQFIDTESGMLTVSYDETEAGWLVKILSQPPHDLSAAERQTFREKMTVSFTWNGLKIKQVHGQQIVYSEEPEEEKATRCGNDPSPTYQTIQEYFMFKPTGKGVLSFMYKGTSLDRRAWLSLINSIVWD